MGKHKKVSFSLKRYSIYIYSSLNNNNQSTSFVPLPTTIGQAIQLLNSVISNHDFVDNNHYRYSILKLAFVDQKQPYCARMSRFDFLLTYY